MNDAPLDIKQLEAFAAVMSAGSMTGAARLLGKSQPAVSRLIQDLEADIGYPLLHRSGPRISPTAQGVLFHTEVERILVSLKHIRERTAAIGAGELPAVELAAISALAAGVVPRALSLLAADLLPRHIHVQSLSAEGVIQSVLSQSAGFGIASLPFEHPGLDVHWIGEAPCVAALAEADPLAAHDVVPVAALAERRLITMANPYRLRRRVDEALAAGGAAPRQMIHANASLTALALAREGLGVAIVEPAIACGLPIQGVVIRPLDVFIPFLFGAISPAGRPLSPTIMALNDALREASMALIPGFSLRDTTGDDVLADRVYGGAPVVEDALS